MPVLVERAVPCSHAVKLMDEMISGGSAADAVADINHVLESVNNEILPAVEAVLFSRTSLSPSGLIAMAEIHTALLRLVNTAESINYFHTGSVDVLGVLGVRVSRASELRTHFGTIASK